MKSKGGPISLEDLPNSIQAKAIHIAPIAGEISYEVIKYLKKYSGCLSIDPQGMTRRFNSKGMVKCSADMDQRLLGLIDIYKSSFEEIVALTKQSDLRAAIKTIHGLGPKIVIVTMGAKGSVLSIADKIYNIPACHSEKVVDPTGAGDVFIGAFLTEYVAGKDPLWCACVGSAAASFVVEGVGATFFGERNDIYNRANSIYDK